MDAIFVYLFKVVNIFWGGILSLAIAQHNIIKKLEAIFVYLFKVVNFFFFFAFYPSHNIIKKLYVAHVKITYKIWLP